jgi:hypothetical protein
MAADVDDGLVNHLLESDFENGTFVNGTLNITGTITSDSTNVNWQLFDEADLISDLVHGAYFTEVTPLSVERWNWSLEIDVSPWNCACILVLSHKIGNQKEPILLHKTIFIGEGPFSPIILPKSNEFITDSTMVDSTNFGLEVTGTVANGVLNESTLITSYCKVTSGRVCDNSTIDTRELSINWSGNDGILMLNSEDLFLSEGEWWFQLSLRDINLLQSSFTLPISYKVDFSPPIAVLVTDEKVNESTNIILDGSASSDGIWTSDLQAVWYITEPNGTIRNPSELENQGLSLILNPITSGNWTVRLEVIDIRGRISSNETTFEVLNVVPEVFISLDELNLNNHRYRMPQWADWSLDGTESYDVVDDYTLLVHRWYVDGELVSNDSRLDVSELDLKPGDHEVVLEVIDSGGASGTSSMILEVYADAQIDTNSTPILGWLTLTLVMLVLIVFAVKYAKSREDASLSVPRWQDNRQSEVDSDEDSVEAMWNKPALE